MVQDSRSIAYIIKSLGINPKNSLAFSIFSELSLSDHHPLYVSGRQIFVPTHLGHHAARNKKALKSRNSALIPSEDVRISGALSLNTKYHMLMVSFLAYT